MTPPPRLATRLTLVGSTAVWSELDIGCSLQPEPVSRLAGRGHGVSERLDDAADFCDLAGVAWGEFAGADEQAVLEADSEVAAQHGGFGGEAHLMASRRQHRPFVVGAEQLVRHGVHVNEVVQISAHTAKDAEDHLDEERRLDPALINEPGEVVEMPEVVAFELELGAVRAAKFLDDVLEISECVLEDEIACHLEEFG